MVYVIDPSLITAENPTAPTFVESLSVSHGRLDGEEFAWAFWEQATRRWAASGVFRGT